MTKITKAVFPVAGIGSRFLPATKANPKEMLPIVDKPLIQYAVEEAIAAGINELIFVTSYSKRSIEDHFDSNFELETRLEQAGKEKLLNIVRNVLPEGVSCAYIRQQKPLGLGHSVYCAKNLIGDEPFAILLADDLIDGGEISCLEQMVQAYNTSHANIIAVEKITPEQTRKYGVVDPIQKNTLCSKISGIIEKPEPEMAPSNLGVVGRYILHPDIFDYLEKTEKGAGGEIQLTDAIEKMLHDKDVLAYQFKGTRYDCGSKLGYLQATVEYALNHEEIGEEFRAYLQNRKEKIQKVSPASLEENDRIPA